MPDGHTSLAPLRLAASLHQTIWGGQSLAEVAGKRIPPDAAVGESWETEVSNRILNGPLARMTLGQVVAELDVELLGTRAIEVFGHRFPLLAKFIDAEDKLSVQVHPSDQQAERFSPGALGKTEAWYVLRASPESRLVVGFERPVTEAQVRSAISENSLETLLHSFVVQAGDVVFVPAGTVHAIGAGVVLYELQEYSDITYRLYDYGRVQPDGSRRELHVEQGIGVLKPEPRQRDCARVLNIASADSSIARRVLAACRYFVLEEFSLAGSAQMTTQPTTCEIVSVLEGACEIQAGDGAVLLLGPGDTIVLPALLGDWEMRAAQTCLLRSYVPVPDDPSLIAWEERQA